jgi:enterochelin esterase-like enzyme
VVAVSLANPSRVDRVVGGISRGASWALHLGLKYWETFSAFGGHSLPVFWEDAPSVNHWLDDIPSGQHPRIYVDYAQSDQKAIRKSAGWFIEQLDDKNIPYTFSTTPGTHSEDYWGGHLEDYLQFYLSEW